MQKMERGHCTPQCPNYPRCELLPWLDTPDVVALLRKAPAPRVASLLRDPKPELHLDKAGDGSINLHWMLPWMDPATKEMMTIEYKEPLV